MAKDKLIDLRHHLFAQLERLGDDTAMKNPINLEKELKKAEAISKVSQTIVNAAKLEVDLIKAMKGANANMVKPPFLLEESDKKK